MNNFNIEDKIRIKKLSREKFEEIYHQKHNLGWNYDIYLNYNKNYFNQTFEIKKIIVNRIYCKNCSSWFFKEEVEKVNYLKTKYKIVNKILNNKRSI